jgi:hypothetical protein
MTPDLQLQREIEAFLLQAGGWVSREALVERFDVNERSLRAKGRRPGLLDGFAVSCSDGGFIHHKFLPTDEWLQIKHRMRRHAVAELRKTKRWDEGRQNCRTANNQLTFLP